MSFYSVEWWFSIYCWLAAAATLPIFLLVALRPSKLAKHAG
jgi:hypothetical protein